MVYWTDAERHNITDLWRRVDPDKLGPQAVARLLIVHPWNQRYFATFVNLVDAATIKESPKVASHGKVVLRGLDIAVKNLDSIKATYAKLGELHSDILNMDPSNFTVRRTSPVYLQNLTNDRIEDH
ncbi:hemoglobin subunit beta-like isoform X2 [Silurus meridionalis]|uniref:hemoglobin subunit beta-like isoform X2 n=1 Tax=Silurus meridionalis TaxID=175797 RepID=UPI001EEA1EA5|nr:hemoglobin subunit beta-like isoform X2 [Silurus meridionalis]